VPPDPGEARRYDRRQCDHRLRQHARRVLLHRRGRGGHQGRAPLRADGRLAGPPHRLDEPRRRAARHRSRLQAQRPPLSRSRTQQTRGDHLMPDTAKTPASIDFIDLGAQRRRLGARVDEAILRVVDHGKYILGPEVAELERKLAQFCGAKHCIGVANGTDALLLGLMAKGVGAGDAVLVPSFTFAATAEVVALVGATPVFVDVQEDSFNMDAASLEAGIAAAKKAGLKPVSVIAVDLFGQPADYDAIENVARRHGLWLMADAAQSFGASYRGRKVGSIGDIVTTSFFPAKPLGCYGDGGAIFTDDDEIARIIRS